MKNSGKIVAGVVPLFLSACGPLPSEQTAPQDVSAPSTQTARLSDESSARAGDELSSTGVHEERPEMSYFCDPYYSDPYCGCPYYDPYCEGLPPPPPPPPSAPEVLTYTPFSESSSIRVSWRPAYTAQHYELERSTNGNWSQIYSGSDVSASGGIYSEGIYGFRVRACNDSGCSPYLTEPEMRFSYGPARTFSGNRLTREEEFMRLFTNAPRLGLGYDQLRQELTANKCLNMSGAVTSTQPMRSKDFKLSVATSRSELFTSLNLTQNLSVSAKYGKFSASYTGKKELLSTATRIDETAMVVASLRDQVQVETLDNPSFMSLSSDAYNLLASGRGDLFRNACGDSHIYSITYGRDFYITFQLKSFNYSQDEIRSQTHNLKVDIGSYANGSYDTTKRTQITQKYSGYDVEARVITNGSSAYVTGVTTLDDALRFMKDFEAEPISNATSPLDYELLDYTVPSGIPSYPDYRPYKTVLQRWYSFDQQLGRRCAMFDEDLYSNTSIIMNQDARSVGAANGTDLRDACFKIKRSVLENIQKCEDTTKWSQCLQPDSTACGVQSSSESCLTYANRIPYWSPVESTLSLDGELGSGFSSDSTTINGSACLYGTGIRDQRIKSVDCIGQDGCPYALEGVTVKTREIFNASQGFHSWDANSKCLNARVTISRPGWWKAGARIHQTQTVSGLIAQSLSYQF